jgi:hypothetical protein
MPDNCKTTVTKAIIKHTNLKLQFAQNYIGFNNTLA